MVEGKQMAVYDEIPVPGIYKGDTYWDDELLASYTGRFTQWGVTLGRAEPGTTRTILLGTVLARSDVDKKYYPYAADGEDGLNIPRGFLRRSAKLTDDRDQFGNLVVSGILKLSKCKGLDQNVLDTLRAVADEANNTLRL
jgi:hypothetical protein